MLFRLGIAILVTLTLAAPRVGARDVEFAAQRNKMTFDMVQAGDLRGAFTMARMAVESDRANLGEAHPEYAASLYNLAAIHQMRGEFDATEPIHRDALDMLEQLVGADHLFVAEAPDDLAALFEAQDKTAEAEPLRQRAAAIRAPRDTE